MCTGILCFRHAACSNQLYSGFDQQQQTGYINIVLLNVCLGFEDKSNDGANNILNWVLKEGHKDNISNCGSYLFHIFWTFAFSRTTLVFMNELKQKLWIAKIVVSLWSKYFLQDLPFSLVCELRQNLMSGVKSYCDCPSHTPQTSYLTFLIYNWNYLQAPSRKKS